MFTFTTQPDGGYSLQVEQPEGCYDECWGGWVQINAGSQTPTTLHVTFMGTVAGTITDADSDPAGAPLQYVSVRLDEWTTTWTDEHGHYEFPPVPIGEHRVACSPGPRYGVAWGRWDERTVAVAHAETVEASWGLHRLAPDVAIDVIGPTGTVGATAHIDYTVRYQPGVYDPRQVTLWTVQTSDDGQQQWSRTLPGSGWYWFGELRDTQLSADELTRTDTYRVSWETAGEGAQGYHNGDATVAAAVELGDVFHAEPLKAGEPPLDALDAGTAGGDTVTADLQNLFIADLTTSEGNPDYVLVDPDTMRPAPWVEFTIGDRGPSSDANGQPWRYQWTVYLRDTRSQDWQGNYWQLSNTVTGPRTVRVGIPTSGWGTETRADGTVYPERGSYTFEVEVRKVGTQDDYWAKWPYLTRVATEGEGLGYGHDAHWTATGELQVSYELTDALGQDASEFEVTVVDPDFNRDTATMPTAVGVPHVDYTVFSTSPEEVRGGTYIVIFVGTDGHGADAPGWNACAPGCYRERECKRMLAVNARIEADVDLAWKQDHEEDTSNPQEFGPLASAAPKPANGPVAGRLGFNTEWRLFADTPRYLAPEAGFGDDYAAWQPNGLTPRGNFATVQLEAQVKPRHATSAAEQQAAQWVAVKLLQPGEAGFANEPIRDPGCFLGDPVNLIVDAGYDQRAHVKCTWSPTAQAFVGRLRMQVAARAGNAYLVGGCLVNPASVADRAEAARQLAAMAMLRVDDRQPAVFGCKYKQQWLPNGLDLGVNRVLGVGASPLLRVWRRLWIEEDAMRSDQPTTIEGHVVNTQASAAGGTWLLTDVPVLPREPVDRFAGGQLALAGFEVQPILECGATSPPPGQQLLAGAGGLACDLGDQTGWDAGQRVRLLSDRSGPDACRNQRCHW